MPLNVILPSSADYGNAHGEPLQVTTSFTNNKFISHPGKLHVVYAEKLTILRFIAICSTVWGHSLLGWDTLKLTGKLNYLQTIVLQLGRLGTIIFFIISGYFLSNRIKQYTITSYLKHRFKSVIFPWLIFVLLCVMLQLLLIYAPGQLINTPFKKSLPVIITLLSSSIFYAAYWFIPVSIFSACVLVLFKKHIQSRALGIVLGLVTLFYCINLYCGWIDANHTKSLAGYIFFMWLGTWVGRNINAVNAFTSKLNWYYVVAVLLILFAGSCNEAVLLRSIGCKDPFASIRFSNILLSCAIFLAFLKFKSIYQIKKLKPEKYVYGIYLVHSIILLEITPIILRALHKYNITHNIFWFLIVQVCFAAIIILISYVISALIKNSRLHFLIGR